MGEFSRLSAGGTNRLGKIRVIEPHGVPRIQARKALFLDTSHPDLYEQFVPHSLYFKPNSGLYFEDSTRTPPVTKSTIYPENDPFVEKMKNLKPLENALSLTFKPASDASNPMSCQEYEKIAKSWFTLRAKQLTSPKEKMLHQVCKVYTNLQQHRDEINLPSRSLHRLEQATKFIMDPPSYSDSHKPDWKDATQLWLWRHAPTTKEYDVIAQLIDQADN